MNFVNVLQQKNKKSPNGDFFYTNFSGTILHIVFHMRRNRLVSGAYLWTCGSVSVDLFPVHIGFPFLSSLTRHDVFVSLIIISRSLFAKSRLSKIATFSVL